jgi:hypothetical protein
MFGAGALAWYLFDGTWARENPAEQWSRAERRKARAKLERGIEADEQRRHEAFIRSMYQAEQDAKDERDELLAEVAGWCDEDPAACGEARRGIRAEAQDKIRAAIDARKQRRADRAQLRKQERAQRRRYGRRPVRTTAAERRSESDDRVLSNIPPELEPLWYEIKRHIKGGPRKSRTEEFLEYADAHPDEVIAAQEAALPGDVELGRQWAEYGEVPESGYAEVPF